MEETACDVKEWHKHFKEWNSYCCMEFMNWVANYSEENPDLKLEEAITAFRMVMDTGYGEELVLESYATGWTDMRGVFGK